MIKSNTESINYLIEYLIAQIYIHLIKIFITNIQNYNPENREYFIIYVLDK